MSEDAERIIDIYDRYAELWDNDRLRTLFERSWLDRFLAMLPSSSSVLDIGCGTAEPIARYLIEAGHAVTGVDSSPVMINICKGRFPNHDWLVADMRTLSVAEKFMVSLHGTASFTLPMMFSEECFRFSGCMPHQTPLLCAQAAHRTVNQSVDIGASLSITLVSTKPNIFH